MYSLPPIAVLTTGRFGAFLLSLILSACFWIPGIIYAILVTKYYADKRRKELLEAQNMRIIKQ